MTYVYIGRFQPFTKAHFYVIEEIAKAMKIEDTLMIFIGSAEQEGTIKNPLPAGFREAMIRNCLQEAKWFGLLPSQFEFVYLYDSPYDYDLWIADLSKHLYHQGPITIVGMEDIDEYAKRLSGKTINDQYWELPPYKLDGKELHATDVRRKILAYESIDEVMKCFPAGINKDDVEYIEQKLRDILHSGFEQEFEFAGVVPTVLSLIEVFVPDVTGSAVLFKKKNGKYALPEWNCDPKKSCLKIANEKVKEILGKNVSEYTSFEGVYDVPFRNESSNEFYNVISNLFHTQIPNIESYNKAKENGFVWLNREEIETTKASKFYADHKKIVCQKLSLDYYRA